MLSSDILLDLVTQLQRGISLSHGRRALLNFLLTNSDARLALLFRVDQERQVLHLLERRGLRSSPVLSTDDHAYGALKQLTHTEEEEISLAVEGLFGMALESQDMLVIHDAWNASRCLPEERNWLWEGAAVIMCQMGQREDLQGVLVLCFGSEQELEASEMLRPEGKGNFLICGALLASYLTRQRPAMPSGQVAAAYPVYDVWSPVALSGTRPIQNGAVREDNRRVTSTREADQLEILYELGLLANTPELEQSHERILQLFCKVIRASAGGLLLASSNQQTLEVVASKGDEEWRQAIKLRLDKEALFEGVEQQRGEIRSRPLGSLLGSGAGRGIAPARLQVECVIISLSYEHTILGCVLLQMSGVREPSSEQLLFLKLLGSIAALILRNHELRENEMKLAINQERGRIARDIHDGPIQKLTHVLHKLDFVQRVFVARPETALAEVESAYEVLQASVQDLRQSISSFLPTYLVGRNFDAAARVLLEEYEQSQPQLKLEYQFDTPELFPAELEAPAFYLLQEALSNIRKHSGATVVRIQIRVLSDFLLLQISDNGRGFSQEQVPSSKHFGLRTMRERVELANGTWSMLSNPGEGTIIKARFPLRSPAFRLTRREREVLNLMREGYTNRAIAGLLSISTETVKSHVHHIIQKMQVKDRTQAAVIATQQKWV